MNFFSCGKKGAFRKWYRSGAVIAAVAGRKHVMESQRVKRTLSSRLHQPEGQCWVSLFAAFSPPRVSCVRVKNKKLFSNKFQLDFHFPLRSLAYDKCVLCCYITTKASHKALGHTSALARWLEESSCNR